MPGRLDGTIKVSIPDIRTELKKLPDIMCDTLSGSRRCRIEFLKSFDRELKYCITRALSAKEGQVVFSDLQVPAESSGQYIMNFEVFDRAKPRSNSYNWHGQNTSQWVYAGCILYQDGRVSTHH